MAIFLPWLIIKLSYFCSFHQPHSNGVSCWVRMGLHSNNTDKKKDSNNNNNNNNKFISLLKYFRENSIRKKGSLPRKFEVFHIFILFYYTSFFINYCQERLVIPECDKVKHVQSNLSTKATLGIEIRNHCRSIMWQLGEKGHSTVIFNVNNNGVTIPHPKTSVTLHLLCTLPVKVTSLQCIINFTSIPKVAIGKRLTIVLKFYNHGTDTDKLNLSLEKSTLTVVNTSTHTRDQNYVLTFSFRKAKYP